MGHLPHAQRPVVALPRARRGAALAVGALGEVLDYRLCVTLCGAVAMAACWLLIWGRRAAVRGVYEKEDAA